MEDIRVIRASNPGEVFRKEYFARIHRAQDYIEENLSGSLLLDEIARAANFSPFHFHRLYTAITGETLFQFIQRIRLERAASALCRNSEESITAIAIDQGFSSSAVFARAFRAYFGVSASAYRKASLSKDGKVLGKDGKAAGTGKHYSDDVNFDHINRSREMRTIQAKSVEVRDMSSKQLAYVRHVGPYAGDSLLFEKLFGQVFSWAGPRGLFRPAETEIICIYHDDPEITEQNKLRISAGITVPPGSIASGGIALLEINAGKYACAHFEIATTEFAAAWNWICGEWLPQSGWQLADGQCYECSLNDHKQHPEGKHIVEIRIPVKPL